MQIAPPTAASILVRSTPAAPQRCDCESPVDDATPPSSPIATETRPTDDGGAGEPSGAGTRARGLLEKLESGHFRGRGVADVRLRINFFDELAARAEERADAVIREQAPALGGAVDAGLGSVLDAAGATDEARDGAADLLAQFQATLEGTLDEAGNDTGDLRERLTASFDGFISQLRDLLAPSDEPPDESDPIEGDPADPVPITPIGADSTGVATAVAPPIVTDTNAPVDNVPEVPVESPTSALEDAIASLTSAFAGALESLMASVDDALGLPEPVAPSNNGRAFARFLAQYDALRAARDGNDGIDAVA